jgi:hypothetical protein
MAVATGSAQGSKVPPTAVLKATPATNLEREAAARLGTIYAKLSRRGETPLRRWAILPEKGLSDNYRPFTTVLGEVYGADSDRLLKYGPAAPSRFTLYKKDLDTAMSRVIDSTFTIATRTLSANAIELTTLWRQLGDPKRAEWLHKASDEIVAAFRREKRKEEAALTGQPPPPDVEEKDRKTGQGASYLTEADLKRVHERVAKTVVYAGDDVLSILFEHPEGMRILGAYAESAGAGTVRAMDRVRQAIEANRAFAEEAIEGRRALRYPFFVLSGVAHRNLRDVPGFTEFALNYCQVLTSNLRETALMFAGGAVAILSLIIAGPGAPFLLASLVLGGADLAFAGMGVWLAFVREREQDLANRASRFKGEANQYATPVVYRDTIMGGLAGLLSAIAFFRVGKELREFLKTSAKAPVGTISLPPPAPKDDTRLIAAGNKSTDGRPTASSKGTNDSLTGNNLTRKEEPLEYVAATSKKTDRTLDKLREEQRRASFRKELAEQEKKGLRVVDEEKETRAPQRMTGREGSSTGAADPEAQLVPNRNWRENERANILKQIENKEKEYRRLVEASRPVDKKRKEVSEALLAAKRQGNMKEVTRLEAELKAVVNDYEGSVFEHTKVAKEGLALRAWLNRTSGEYFEALASAASKRPEYTTVQGGSLADHYKPLKPGDTLTVEHVKPKSVIFQMDGFLQDVSWEQQIFLFNYRKNLVGAGNKFNISRGVVPYSKLNQAFVDEHLKLGELKKLSDIEAEVDRDIRLLLKHPTAKTLWQRHGYDGPF